MIEPIGFSGPHIPGEDPVYKAKRPREGESLPYYHLAASWLSGNISSVANPIISLLATPFRKNIKVEFEFPDERGAPQTIEEDVAVISSRTAFLNETRLASILAIPLAVESDLKVIKEIIPSIVRISVESTDGKRWYGSGVIVDPLEILPDYLPGAGEYFILTNKHVAENARYLSARLANGMEILGDVVESKYRTKLLDGGMDIALVRIVVPFSLQTAKIGDPNELETGQTIYTAGHPRALPNVSITKGIISNPKQETGSLSKDIQSDAPINPGNSGGPSFNQRGEIVGLNTYTFKNGEDLTFTKPIDKQIEALRRLWEYGHIIRGGFGFKVEDYSLIDREKDGFPGYQTGAKVAGVEKGSSAERAGLKVGDIITWMEVRADGYAVNTLDVDAQDPFEAEGVIKRWAAGLVPGTKVYMMVWRKEGASYSTKEIEVTVETLKEE